MKVPATRIFFSEEDIEFITKRFKDILRGNSYLSMSKYGEEFEAKFSAYIGTQYGVACNSGTSALELICRAIGIEGKEVIIPSNTFIATANAVLNAGGTPVFADCNDTMCLDAEDAIGRITDKTAAIMQVHIGGLVSNSIIELKKVCEERDILLLEDAAQAHGSELNGTKAGAFGIAAGFSFFSTKVMTTGEGGMVTTNDRSLVEKMKSKREFGKVKKGIFTNCHTSIGYNWRMPEISALLGLRQLASIQKFIKRRNEIAQLYNDELENISEVKVIHPDKNSSHNYFKYIVVLLNHDRAEVHKALETNDISPSGYVYELPLHKQPVFPKANSLSLQKTEFYCNQHICLPIFYGMTDDQAIYVTATLKKILKDLPIKNTKSVVVGKR